MEEFSSYGLIMAACVAVIISSFFNRLASKTSIPSVLLLVALGILLSQLNRVFSFAPDLNLMPLLEILGIVGLIMIVLEAALELKISRDKIGVIWRSLFISFISLVVNAFLIAWVIKTFWSLEWFVSFIYAVPLSIISSAIIIPSVQTLPENKKEFLTYESTFSDILGIMVFYFLLEAGEPSTGGLAWSITGSILLTIVVSFVAGYGLIYIFQNLKSGTKLFLLIAVLLLLYSIGKLFHLSSLLLILVFGLILSNNKIFIVGPLKKHFNEGAVKKIYDDFLLITIESSFVVRTFFFLVFGITISLGSLVDSRVVLVSLCILAVIYGSRFLFIYLFFRKSSFPQWQIAPRGLITILLFFAIPEEYHFEGYAEIEGVLLFVILVSSIAMAWSMIRFRKMRQDPDDLDLEVADTVVTDEIIAEPENPASINPEIISQTEDKSSD